MKNKLRVPMLQGKRDARQPATAMPTSGTGPTAHAQVGTGKPEGGTGGQVSSSCVHPVDITVLFFENERCLMREISQG